MGVISKGLDCGVCILLVSSGSNHVRWPGVGQLFTPIPNPSNSKLNVDSRYCQSFGHWPALVNSRERFATMFAIRFDATGANAAIIMTKWDLLPLTCLIVMQRFAASKARVIRSPNKKMNPAH